jgi:hypothetical protein
MTGASAHESDSTQMAGDPDDGRARRRTARTRIFDAVPEGGKIDRTITSPFQIIMAVTVLVVVTVVSFVAVSVVGDLCTGNPVTYWMIELIFALLCGGGLPGILRVERTTADPPTRARSAPPAGSIPQTRSISRSRFG